MLDTTSITKLCEEKGIRMIDFKMTDLDGRWRHITIPKERFNESVFTCGIGFDGSNYGYAPVEKSDMVFIPDPATAVVDPFTDVPTLSMCGNVYVIGKENTPFDQYPRNVSLRAIEYMKSEKIADRMLIGPEFEFHLFDHVSYTTSPRKNAYTVDTRESSWNSGNECEENKGYSVPAFDGYHIAAPNDVAYSLRSRMCMYMEDWGIDVKYHHHEVGGYFDMYIVV